MNSLRPASRTILVSLLGAVRSPLGIPRTSLPADSVGDGVTNLGSALHPTVGDPQRLQCNGNWVTHRDSVDNRPINEYPTGGGTMPASDAVGSYPPSAPGRPCVDSDHHALPDAWGITLGLDPKGPSSASKLNVDGYTNLELIERKRVGAKTLTSASSGLPKSPNKIPHRTGQRVCGGPGLPQRQTNQPLQRTVR